MIPEPVFKGIHRELATGREYRAFFLQHHADAGESSADDCLLTVPLTLEGGAQNCGESGYWPAAEFKSAFQFARLK